MTFLPETNSAGPPSPETVKKELLKGYPTKVARKRDKQILINQVGEGDLVPAARRRPLCGLWHDGGSRQPGGMVR